MAALCLRVVKVWVFGLGAAAVGCLLGFVLEETCLLHVLLKFYDSRSTCAPCLGFQGYVPAGVYAAIANAVLRAAMALRCRLAY